MQWLKTFSLVIRTQVNSLCEHFENPERVLNQLIIDMEEELERVRQNVTGVLADEIQLGRQVDKSRAEVDRWHERATVALARGDESSATAALEQKLQADERAEKLAEEYAKHQEETKKLRKALHDLEAKIRQARNKRSLLLARMARVESSRSVQDVLRRADGSSAVAQFQRLERRVERAEAMEEAYDRLDDEPGLREVEERFAEQERHEKLQKELEELKRRVQASD